MSDLSKQDGKTNEARLAAPAGYRSWLNYAIKSMDTRSLYLETIADEAGGQWGRDVSREEMRQAAQAELAALEQRGRELPASSESVIRQSQLEAILISAGIIQREAIEDPYGYDGGKTELAMTVATQEINELMMHRLVSEHGRIT